MQNALLAASRRAAAGVVAGAAVTAGQSSVQARELPLQVPERTATAPARKALDEDWLGVELDQEVLVFKPYTTSEIDAAVAQVTQVLESRGPRKEGRISTDEGVSTPHATGYVSPASTDTSLGAEADGVLSQSVHGDLRAGELAPAPAVPAAGVVAAASGESGEQMQDLLTIANRLLRRPGLQREVFKCMLEDEEVRTLMLRQSRNLDCYLNAVGIHTPGLLPEPESVSSEGLRARYRSVTSARIEDVTDDHGADGAHGGGKKDVLKELLDVVAKCVDRTGSLLAGLGGWLRDRVDDVAGHLAMLFTASVPHERHAHDSDAEEEAEGTAAQREGSGPQRARRSRRKGDAVLGAVMVVTVAVMCMLLAGRPLVFARAAAATAAATATAAAAQQAGSQRRTASV